MVLHCLTFILHHTHHVLCLTAAAALQEGEMNKVDFAGGLLLLITTQKLIYVLGSQQIWK